MQFSQNVKFIVSRVFEALKKKESLIILKYKKETEAVFLELREKGIIQKFWVSEKRVFILLKKRKSDSFKVLFNSKKKVSAYFIQGRLYKNPEAFFLVSNTSGLTVNKNLGGVSLAVFR